MQYLGWDSLFCKFCIPIRRIRNFDPCPAQGSWTTLAAEFVLGPKRRGKKLMNIFLGQDIGHLRQANLKMWSDQSLAELFCSQKNVSTRSEFINQDDFSPKSSSPNPSSSPSSHPRSFKFLPLKGTPLHSMARWASRLDDLSHVLAWGRCVLAPFLGGERPWKRGSEIRLKGWVSDP